MRSFLTRLFKTQRKGFFYLVFFAVLVGFNCAGLFLVFAQNPDEQSNVGGRPDWCTPAGHDGLSVVCGTVTGAFMEPDHRGIFMPNQFKNVTVAIFEENPISPTGKLNGLLTHLFSSTYTNEKGQFRVIMRKESPDVRVHLVVLCSGYVAFHTVLDSWHDYWKLYLQVPNVCYNSSSYVTGEELRNHYYVPSVPLDYVGNRQSSLGCAHDVGLDIPVGTTKNEQPTVNTVVKEDNYEHRHTKNEISFNIPEFNLGIFPSSIFPDSIGFSSQGGWWEPDCLLGDRYPKEYRNNSGDEYQCKTDIDTISCEYWLENSDRIIHQPEDRGLCDDSNNPEYNEPMARDDRITRPFFDFIPKVTTDENPFRRMDIRSDIENFIQDPLIPIQWTSRFFGSPGVNPAGGVHVFLRPFLGEKELDRLPNCSILQSSNDPYTYTQEPSRNKFLNCGPMGCLAPYSTGYEIPKSNLRYIYYSQLRNLQDEICLINGDINQPVRYCEIQPPWLQHVCIVGDSGCSDPLTPCGDFLLDSSYFSYVESFARTPEGGADVLGMTGKNKNDSYATEDDPVRITWWEDEGISPDQSENLGVRERDKYAANSTLTPTSISDIETFVPETETISTPMKMPFTDIYEDYIKEKDWNMVDYGGNMASHCTVGKPQYDLIIEDEEDEVNELFHIANMFDGNDSHLEHNASAFAGYINSQDAFDRDETLFDIRDIPDNWNDHDLNIAAVGLVRNAVNIPEGRDVWDSLLSFFGGDTKLHDFNIEITEAAGIAWGAILERDHPFKQFGDRHESLLPVVRPGYEVTNPLSEETFPNEFPLPEYTPNSDSSECLMPDSWGEHMCYPWTPLPADESDNNNKCNTYRENDYGVSRTCKVDECRAFWQTEVRSCYCTTFTGLDFTCIWGPATWELNSGDCDCDDRYLCAFNQETTITGNDSRLPGQAVPTRIIHSSDPNGSRHSDYAGAPNPDTDRYSQGAPSFWNQDPPDNWGADPPDVRNTNQCSRGNLFEECYTNGAWDYDKCPITGLPYVQSRTASADGPVIPRCNMSVAGPMEGGAECNGTLEISDSALRTVQESPLERDQINMNEMFRDGYPTYLALKPPYTPSIDGGRDMLRGSAKISHWDGQYTNDATESMGSSQSGMFSYGADLETGGNSSIYTMAQYSTPPRFPYVVNTTTPDVFFHCNFQGTYTPDPENGEYLNIEPYINYDPEMNDPPILNGWPCPIYQEPEPIQIAKVFGEDVESKIYANGKNISFAQDISVEPGACGVHDINRCMAHESVSDNLSDTFWAVVNNAANALDVPASTLMAVMVMETDFLEGTMDDYLSDDSVVYQWSIPWYGREYHGGSAQCFELVWSAEGPYQILKGTFELFTESSQEACMELEELQSGRCRTASRCNFLDASYVAADHLDLDSKSCSNYTAADFISQLESYAGGTEFDPTEPLEVFEACR